MKKKNIVLFGTLFSLGLLGSQTTLAATYPSALQAVSNGTVEFTADDENSGGVPDPTDPGKPVMPVDPSDPDKDPLNPNKDTLRIMYAPDLNFGQHAQTTNEIKQLASAIKVKDVNADGSLSTDSREVVPFVTTLDMRTNRSTGWTLSVTSSKFTSTKTPTHTLEGSYIEFSSLNYADSTGGTSNTAPKPAVKAGSIQLNAGTKVNLSAATVATDSNQGIGKFSLAIGDTLSSVTDVKGGASREATNGATFVKPVNQAVNIDKYTATLTWDLAPTASSL